MNRACLFQIILCAEDGLSVHQFLVLLYYRVLEGHVYDTTLCQEDGMLIARRGVQEVEGGYRFTRDLRLKEVCVLIRILPS